ncbi:hypothetical protein MY4038_010202, partial [Beauveria bassiana]
MASLVDDLRSIVVSLSSAASHITVHSR